MDIAPKDGTEIIAQASDDLVTFRVAWKKGRWMCDGAEVPHHVVAWMPLPLLGQEPAPRDPRDFHLG